MTKIVLGQKVTKKCDKNYPRTKTVRLPKTDYLPEIVLGQKVTAYQRMSLDKK